MTESGQGQTGFPPRKGNQGAVPAPLPADPALIPAEPVLKWAGGKRRLVEQYAKHFRIRGGFGDYHEPFFGGGAVYFWLWNEGKLKGKTSYLSDINPELVNLYQMLQSSPEPLYALLEQHQAQHGEEHYYAVRKTQPVALTEIERAARLLYLNRTCFNGLYRENSRGEFNVPMGRYVNPRILHRPGLEAANGALSGSTIACQRYSSVEEQARPGDLVYFDPPYHPLNPTSSFTSYTQHDFSENDQVELAGLFRRLVDKGVKVRLSNSDAPLINDLYKGFKKVKVQAARAINSKADRRQKITELLIVG